MPNYVYVVVVVLFVSSVGLSFYNSYAILDRVLTFSVLQSATALGNALDSFRKIYTDEVVAKIRGSQFAITHEFQDNPQAIPLPASMTIKLGATIGKSGLGSQASLYSPYPFPWRKDGGLTDAFRQEAWEALKENSDKDYYKIVVIDGEKFLRYARADTLKKSCVECHNSHPQTPKNDWQVGDTRGVLEILQPMDAIISNARREVVRSNVLSGLSGFLGLFAVLLVVTTFRKRLAAQKELSAILQEKNSELEQFAYRTSHDLKAPLTTIKGLASFIVEDSENGDIEEVKENALRIRRHSKKLESLVVDILNLARSDLTNQESVDVNLEDLFWEITEKVESLAADRKVDVSFQIPSGTSLYSQPARLEQIFQNLITNGIKYSDPEKEGRFVLATYFEQGGKPCISVEDNGLGIPDEYQDKVFDMFSRFHANAAEGSGLGMSIVKKNVEALRGNIGFSSSSMGTKFIVSLPRSKG